MKQKRAIFKTMLLFLSLYPVLMVVLIATAVTFGAAFTLLDLGEQAAPAREWRRIIDPITAPQVNQATTNSEATAASLQTASSVPATSLANQTNPEQAVLETDNFKPVEASLSSN